MNFIIRKFITLLPTRLIHAHCDIPCGIYDPHTAQLASQTVLRMVQKLKELQKPDKDEGWLEYKNSMTRMILTKEVHAETCKREVLILWTDYFKAEHLEKFPDLHDLVWKTTKLCSDNKRAVDEAKAQELVESVDKIAEIFAQTKK